MRSAAALALLYVCVSRAQTPACTPLQTKIDSAMKALDQSRIHDAEQDLSAIEGARNECPAVLLVMARVRASQRNLEESRKLFERYMRTLPNDAEGPVQWGRVLLRAGGFPQAEAMADRALELNAEHSGALGLKGQLLVMRREPEEGRKLLQKAIEIDPGNSDAHFQLGAFFDRRKQHEDAVKQFEAVAALTPADPRAFDYLALNLEQMGESERAEVAFKKGLAVNSGLLSDSFLDFNYGRFLLKQNRLADSKMHLDRAAELAPGVRAVLYERGKLNLRLQRYADAAHDGERALETPDPGHVILDLQVYYLLAEAYARLGDTDRATSFTNLAKTAGIPPKSAERR